MCGIAGLIEGKRVGHGEDLVRQMTKAISHRGPDSDGYWSEGNVHFGHRRLAIVDLSPAGRQPMISRDGRYVLTYNGEIYNHLQLRHELDPAQSLAWRGASDTETLLEALVAWGLESTLQKLNGMFAFALWDRTLRQLSLARDPLGEKPLCYSILGDTIAFASEFRSFEVLPHINPAPDPDRMALYLSRWYVPPPYSIAKDIQKLPQGCCLTWQAQQPVQINRYWSLTDIVHSGQVSAYVDERQALDELNLLLSDAVRIRLMSDVPIGAFLSGGVDSSLVVALMQQHSQRPVKTFSIGFEEGGFNEAPYAKAVSNYLGTEHTERYVSEADALAIVPQLGSIYDEPFADASQIPTTIVSRLAREQVTVALTGEGGDELFAGYQRYSDAQQLWQRTGRIPRRASLARLIEVLPNALLKSLKPVAYLAMPQGAKLDHLVSKIRRMVPILRAQEFMQFYRAYIGTSVHALSFPLGASPGLLEEVAPRQPRNLSNLGQMMWFDTVHLLANDLLVKVDRASMSVGLEGRMPLLDPRVAQLAWRLPDSMKSGGGIAKRPLKAVLDRYVPSALVERPKMGFGVPLDKWLKTPLRTWAEDLLSESRVRRQGLLDPAAVARAWRDYLAGDAHTATEIWSLLMLQSWLAARGR